MAAKKPTRSKKPAAPKKKGRTGNPVSKTVKVTGKRIGSSQRSNQARQQKRRDTR